MSGKSHQIEDAARGVGLSFHADKLEMSFRSPRDNVTLSATVPMTSVPPQDEAGQVKIAERAARALPQATRIVNAIAQWLVSSREDTNHTYHLTSRNLAHLSHHLAMVLKASAKDMAAYMAEAMDDAGLAAHVAAMTAKQPQALRAVTDSVPRFGRRLGWYAVARVLKPRLIVETGVDKGLGGVLLCAALLRNAAEGHPGRYIGTEIRPEAGYLIAEPYAAVGRVAYGDSLTTLKGIGEPIDLFINDSDHSVDYEAEEYRAIAPRLQDGSMIISDNAHASDALLRFAEETGRRFTFFREQPQDHWYPGCGIGFAYR